MTRSAGKKTAPSGSTVGRGRALERGIGGTVNAYDEEGIHLRWGNSLDHYESWPSPTAIISDGAYGVLGFEGDTSSHIDMPSWYEPHVAAWAKHATPSTTLWFWNSELGWAASHPILEKHGFRYVSCNVWDKGIGHLAGNVNSRTLRRFPVVTEVCVQYVREARIEGVTLKRWLRDEWNRTGLPLKTANIACGVKDAAVRKYLDQGHLWYFPPAEALSKLAQYANDHGDPRGRPYFSLDRRNVVTGEEWLRMRSQFHCPHGVTNVWQRPPSRGEERLKAPNGRAAHLSQKPLDLMERIIEASTAPNDVVWEPFGGLFSASLAAKRLGRQAFAAELDEAYFALGMRRFSDGARVDPNPGT